MTEQEWLTCTDPRPMLELLKGKASIRKLRLFCCACCLRVAPLLTEDYVRHALQAITLFEQHLEGLVSDQMVHEVSSKVIADSMDAANAIAHPGEADYYAISAAAATVEFSLQNNVAVAADLAAKAVAYNFLAKSGSPTPGQISSEWAPINRPPGYGRVRWDRDEERMSSIPEYKHAQDAEQRLQCSLLRDIFDNPFRPVTFLPEWRISTVLSLAQGIYSERAFDRMPILADALQDAGCSNENILNHCYSSGPHTRGCWLVDSVTGRA